MSGMIGEVEGEINPPVVQKALPLHGLLDWPLHRSRRHNAALLAHRLLLFRLSTLGSRAGPPIQLA
jgi:hypothetical protein